MFSLLIANIDHHIIGASYSMRGISRLGYFQFCSICNINSISGWSFPIMIRPLPLHVTDTSILEGALDTAYLAISYYYPRAVGTVGCRNIRPSEHRVVGISGFQINGQPKKQKTLNIGCLKTGQLEHSLSEDGTVGTLAV